MGIPSEIEKDIHLLLHESINSDYIFIDLPYYSNIGDTLIWEGTEFFLKSIPHKCLLRASCQTFQYPELEENVVILMMGGGNWGDLYAPHNELRRNVVQRYPNNQIIILPQTIYYEGARNARADATIFRKHKNLYICARDKYSYRFLKAFGFSRNILLVPDMAFCIGQDALEKYKKPTENKNLLFQRVDKEGNSTDPVRRILSPDTYETCDWPNYEGEDPILEHLYGLIQEGRYKEADEYAINVYLPNRFKVGVEHICQYKKVFSNRLHGAILSILLGKEVYILDNSYGKNSQYYNTWLKGMTNVHLCKTKKGINLHRKARFLAYWLLSIRDRLFAT